MGPRIRRPLSAAASRFTEGSMNDRTSNVPPVAFLGPEERARLEKPLRPLSDDWADKQVKKNRLLGTVWDGVRGRLRFRRDADEERRGRTRGREGERREETAGYQQLVAEGFFAAKPGGAVTATAMKVPTPMKTEAGQARPTKDEIMENYQHLVASGFFSSHAIQSTRQPPPSTAASTRTSHEQSRPPHLRWPLSRNTSPSRSRAASPIRSPPSASSRGTKRAAVDHLSDEDANKENDPPTPNKKLRKSASRDISLPKLRNVASRRTILTRSRAASGPHPAKESSKLAKRVLGKLPGARGSLEVPAARRCASGPGMEDQKERLHDANTRVLRSRKSANEGLCVVPDSNRGIPQVPAIPAKFTYGEDRENDGPWRGLRR